MRLSQHLLEMPSFFHHTARGSSLADVNFTGEGLSGLSALFLLLYFCPESWNSIASPQFGEFKRSSFWLLQHHVSCFVFVKVFKVLEGLGTWVFFPPALFFLWRCLLTDLEFFSFLQMSLALTRPFVLFRFSFWVDCVYDALCFCSVSGSCQCPG